MRRISISHVVVSDAESEYASIISGIPGHCIEEVSLSDITILYRGGGTADDARIVPPENEAVYPEPWMFGRIPASGLYLRHVRGVEMRDVRFRFATPDARPEVVRHDAL